MPLEEEFTTYISWEEGAHHTVQGHVRKCRVWIGALRRGKGRPRPKPLLRFPLDGQARWGNSLGLGSLVTV